MGHAGYRPCWARGSNHVSLSLPRSDENSVASMLMHFQWEPNASQEGREWRKVGVQKRGKGYPITKMAVRQESLSIMACCICSCTKEAIVAFGDERKRGKIPEPVRDPPVGGNVVQQKEQIVASERSGFKSHLRQFLVVLFWTGYVAYLALIGIIFKITITRMLITANVLEHCDMPES